MGSPFVGELRLVGFTFAPQGWNFCDGSILPISEYDVLFNLLGTTYGGDGQTTFALPDLRGRAAIHQGTFSGNSSIIGQKSGVESVTLALPQLPSHTHPIVAQGSPGNMNSPTGAYFAGSSEDQFAASGGAVSGAFLNLQGSSQPHENRQPFLCLNYIISLFGIYPSQS